MGSRFKTVLAGAIVAAAAAPAMAGYTPILNPGNGEDKLWKIIADNYGGRPAAYATNTAWASAWNTAQGAIASFTTGGGYTFKRVHDNQVGGSFGIVTDLHSSYNYTTTDQRFSDGVADVRFIVKHAGYTNRFGWNDIADADSTYRDIIGSGEDLIFSTTVAGGLSSNFEMYLNVNNGGTYRKSDNSGGGADQFVTWSVTAPGPNGRTFWFMAVEDLLNGGGADNDFNDWVGEITVIPLPPAAWAGLSTLAGVGLIGFIRRRKNAAQ